RFSLPPTSGECEAIYQLACYSPAQLRHAYDVGPLQQQGLAGAGQTIAIVASFGSPTIENDPRVLEPPWGLPDPPSVSTITPAAAHGVTVVSAAGDTGATDYQSDQQTLYSYRVDSWPSSDPLVTSVGGTRLQLDADGDRTAPDEAWQDGYGAGGGGMSTIFSRP